MSVPRDHHFIPAFFLEQWQGTDDKLIEYTIKRGKLIAKPVGAGATGFERDLYAFPELPPETAQYMEQVFWDYADRTASDALRLHFDSNTQQWTAELRSAWSRFVVGIHLRHPDAMPELRAGAAAVWEGTGENAQAEYLKIKTPEDPPTFDEYMALRDPLTPAKVRVNLIIKTFDNEVLGNLINRMTWGLLDISAGRRRFLLSDRPVLLHKINKPEGLVALPISPTRLFVGVNDPKTLMAIRRNKPDDIVREQNFFMVERARRFVWAHDRSQEGLLKKRMSTKMEATPLFPSLGWPDPTVIPSPS
jgi:hypothetical protein